ncbi:hypothetical protein W97_00050 [Coniosporium apollinis CBS 100218]|uniref:DUF4385 domain-containing protein n=1 Tax=Coniosporium apollinis (strain CBS 100218) TaxID=1168221 RepID=R7YG17_CONA1|nr:uncharacterized protein W97_00050 [Coniosporium apollinis CBS 100218]EON60840.1 hypothetical protein W97_00050 [Coniosporium apollinis CBS 100218]
MSNAPALRDKALRMSYRIGRGEQGVLTFEPYKSMLLPLWRFRTVEIAKKSSADLWERFEEFGRLGDFVGMDMTRKFIQMGMTRAKRYANHAGGRKYDKRSGKELQKSSSHVDHDAKLEASEIFKQVWQRCKAHEQYQKLKEEFLKEQKEWDKEHKNSVVSVKKEDRDGD